MKNLATWIRAVDEPAFAETFGHYPEVRLWNARTEAVPEGVQGLLLTGGEDISMEFLRQPVPDPTLIQDAILARDVWEFDALGRALEERLPVLAICRGLQVLNVALGGTLHLDIPHHDSSRNLNNQPLRYAEGAHIRFAQVNSSHHQALATLGAGLEIEAWCATDEVIEQARLRDYPYAEGVQYHPERDALYRPLFDDFMRHVPHAKS